MANVTENNKLIAEFMGAKLAKDDYGEFGYHYPKGSKKPPTCIWGFSPYALRYNKDFDWLMPVIDKISKQAIIETKNSNETMYVSITVPDKYYQSATGKPIDTLFNSAVEFIKWHNKNKAI